MSVIHKQNLKKLKCYIFKKKILNLCIVYSKCSHKDEKIFKEEESIEILKILALISNLHEYQKMYNHVWRKHKPRIYYEKSRWKRNYLIEEINQNEL